MISFSQRNDVVTIYIFCEMPQGFAFFVMPFAFSGIKETFPVSSLTNLFLQFIGKRPVWLTCW